MTEGSPSVYACSSGYLPVCGGSTRLWDRVIHVTESLTAPHETAPRIIWG